MEASELEPLEYYKWDYSTLVEQLGAKQAEQKVAMYQNLPYISIPCVKDGRLLQTYEGDTTFSSQPLKPILQAPYLTNAEYSDSTDKGISNLPNPEKFKLWQQKQQTARRAKQNA